MLVHVVYTESGDLPFNCECDGAVAGPGQADLCQRDGVRQEVDEDVVALGDADDRQRKTERHYCCCLKGSPFKTE